MTEIADDRSWWADVEHLRPGAADVEHGRSTAEASVPAERAVPPRRGRITGRPLPPDVTDPPAVLRRADVASFADAMDLDGAFGAPAGPRHTESREIVLSGRRETVPDVPHAEPRPPVRGQGSPDRRTVRISGQPGIHAELAERRALREIESRRPRGTVERVGHRPDRVAMWAVMLGLFLVVIAAMSSGGVS